MLAEQVNVVLANMWDYDEVRTDAAQMQEALAGRAIIDQAKGIIMKSSGCSAEAAFDELRRISQHHQVKVADLARLLVDEHQRNQETKKRPEKRGTPGRTGWASGRAGRLSQAGPAGPAGRTRQARRRSCRRGADAGPGQ